ncbi:MAG: AAA family ATPase [Actinobacteria bacterium]|nr:AAA family ATPase [Actinomycetota bacterium]
MTDEPLLIASLRRAVAAAPDDVPLRLHLAEQLVAAGLTAQAVAECAAVLASRPDDAAARELMARALAGPAPTAAAARPASAEPPEPPGPSAAQEPSDGATQGFDWRAAEQDLGDAVPPMFVGVDGTDGGPEATAGADDLVPSAWEIVSSGVTLADVGGMEEVKERLQMAFLAPMRNPELRKLYGKSLRGGLLLYGPPGCGKTFVARAVAGELGAKFLAVGLSDILDMWVGSSERNLHELFSLARREAPCVLFLDEVDALGQKRSQTRLSATRGTVTQLLAELDGVDGANEGVFVLAATNHPWDVDPALRRPGRLDRTLLVLPPDGPAREAVFRHHLRDRPVAGIDLRKLAKATDGYSGADIAHICETASEKALMDGIRTGTARLIDMRDLEAAVREVRPSMSSWFDVARNVVLFGDDDGTYADLRTYLKKVKRL